MRKSIFSKSASSVRADFDAAAFRRRHKDAQENSFAKKEMRKDYWAQEIRESEDPLETAFDLLVPSSDKADTKAGELVRAICRILYRNVNDGDVFYEGYGIETCGDAVAFLCDKIPYLENKFEDIAMRTLTGKAYTQTIEAIGRDIIDEILSDPDLLVAKNTEDMFDYDGEAFIKDNEWEPLYDLDFDLPDSLYEHLNRGDISSRDVAREIESWDYMDDDAEIQINRSGGYGTISNIKKDCYDMFEENISRWLEEYSKELDDEFGDPFEDEVEEE